MKPQHWQRIHGELAQSCLGLFRDNGVSLVLAQDRGSGATQGDAVVSFIGFVGEHLRGQLTILAPVPLVTLSHPLRHKGPIDEDALCDWACELASQLLGRTKNRLLELGLLIQLSTPSTALGRKMRGHDERREGFCVLHFDGAAHRLSLIFDALANESAPSSLRTTEGGAHGVEGDILLF